MNLDIHIDRFRHEVETAIRTFYSYDAFQRLLSERRYVDLMNKNVHFWRIFESSVLTMLFVAIGRLYDDSKDAFSFQKFIKICRDNIDGFKRESLEKRRLNENGSRPDWLDKYLDEAFYAKVKDIDEIAKLAKPHTKKMKQISKEIRNKVIAHAILHDETEISKLFKGTRLNELRDALKAFWSIYIQVHEMYHNGRKPTLRIKDYPYMDEVYGCVKAAVLAGET